MSEQNEPQNKPMQLNIELGEKEAEGIYSNLAIISHSNAEFVFDFTRVLPGVPKARVHARVVMTPQHAKSFANALLENLSKFERVHGTIKNDNNPIDKIGGFGGGEVVN